MKEKINKVLRNFGIELHGSGYIQKLKNSSRDKNEWFTQNELLGGKAKVIFDVGANRGETVSQYLNLFPSAAIHAFEPFPEAYNIFNEKHQHNSKVKLNKYALASVPGKSLLNINKFADTNSLLESQKMGANSDDACVTVGQMEVETNSIDNYCRTYNISVIDILKMDVQGGEMEVLKGSLEALKEQRIKLIYTECYFAYQYVDQPLFHDLSKFLYQYNFVLQDIYDPYYARNHIVWCDALFMNRKYIH